jgi:hypothetical protein
MSMLASARELAHGERQSDDIETALSAASDLVEWGGFREAEEILARLERDGSLHEAIGRLRRRIDIASQFGRDFHEQYLVDALALIKQKNASPGDLEKAADNFIRWGALDEAEIAIARLERLPSFRGRAAALRAALRQLRKSGILSSFSPIGTSATTHLNRLHEANLARSEKVTDRLVVALTGGDRNFWMSLHLFHHFLSKFDVHVLYLHDYSGMMFLNGVESAAPGYEATLALIRRVAKDVEAGRTFVMGFSAGGFAGLRIAADLGAESFLGFGIRTDMSTGSTLPRADYDEYVREHCRDPGMLIDLRPYLAARGSPGRIRLIAAQGAKYDVAHAEHLRGLPNVEIGYLTQYQHHNVMPGLLARGLLPDVLEGFFGDMSGAGDR